MKNEKTKTQDLMAALGAEGKGSTPRRWLRLAGLLLLILVLIVGGSMAMRSRRSSAAPSYLTEAVTRGTLRVTVTATGNLAPTNEVDVGSEVSGLVEKVLVDENDTVKTGQVLAILDTSKLQDSITKSEAALRSAEATLAQANATEKEAAANMSRLLEVQKLSGGKVPSKAEIESAEATLDKARASQLAAKAAVTQARATLSTDQTNLKKASIKSPIDGVVLTRSVEPGQTVAASFQVATLFTIAQDLREMECEVAVDEADVGKVRDGQPATFTVDAYPNRKFTATVKRVNYGSTTTNNVVSYTTTLTVRNEDLSLRPGMTATAQIATVTRENVILVPNAALRFTPGASGGSQSRGVMSSIMPGPPRRDGTTKKVETKGENQQVYVLRNGQPVRVPIVIGETNGRLTEVKSGDVREGMEVVTDAAAAGTAQ